MKMVHNGIEYAEMQLLAEVYECINSHIQPNWSLLNQWQKTIAKVICLESLLHCIFSRKKELLVHQILDKTQHKGTGSWTSISAMSQGTPATMIQAAQMPGIHCSKRIPCKNGWQTPAQNHYPLMKTY